MRDQDPRTCECGLAGYEGGDAGPSKSERVASLFLSLAVRLWCLPVLLLAWLTLGLVIGGIRLAAPLVGPVQTHGLFGSPRRRAHALD